MILVPFRNHPVAENALKYAVQFSKQFEDLDIVCFHCTEKNESSIEDLKRIKVDLEESIQKVTDNESIVVEVIDGE
jgi:hypothetical protein